MSNFLDSLSIIGRKKFVKDFNLPIPVLMSPYFEYYIDLYDKLYDVKKKLKMLEVAVKKNNNNEDLFYSELSKLKNQIISDIKNIENYKKFSNADLKAYNLTIQFKKMNLYKHQNVDKIFFSVDLVKANFQSFNLYDKTILNAESYGEFIKRYSDLEYVQQSKQLRQMIFGNLNPKKQVRIEKFMMQTIFNEIIKNGIFKNTQLISIVHDELIFEINTEEISKEKFFEFYLNLKKVLENSKDCSNYKLHYEIFQLKHLLSKIDNKTYAYVKEFFVKDGDDFSKLEKKPYSFKCCSASFHAQCYKHYNNEKIIKNDTYFMSDKKLSIYCEHIF